MLDLGLLDRYLLELPKGLVDPLKVPQVPIARRVTDTLVERVKPKKKEPEKKDDVLKHLEISQKFPVCSKTSFLTKAKKEISDAVSELVAEPDVQKEPKVVQPSVVYDAKRRIYALMEQDPKVMDYSKLGYGKVAEPLAVNYAYQNYQAEEDEKPKFSAEETLSTEAADKLIEQVFLAQRTATTTGIDPEAKERFAYYILFNQALVSIKYDQFKSNSTEIDGGAGSNFRYLF